MKMIRLFSCQTFYLCHHSNQKLNFQHFQLNLFLIFKLEIKSGFRIHHLKMFPFVLYFLNHCFTRSIFFSVKLTIQNDSKLLFYLLSRKWCASIFLAFAISFLMNCIDGVMVNMLASSEVDRGFVPGRVKPKTTRLVFVASPLGTQL